MHIAQGLFKSLNVNKCTKAGGIFVFWVADWFGLMNDKMGGDLEKIKTVGQYFVEVWKATGMDLSRVRFRWSSDDIVNHAEEYWTQSLDIARRSTLARVKKCCTIMGRAEDKLSAAQIMYPIMQSTDIFFLKADICQLGVDQRKCNMLARDYCDAAGIKNKPIILSHHMLYGLTEGQAKMSKSNPDSAIFMEDSAADVERKIRKAHCPKVANAATKSAEADEIQLEKDDLMNPCLDYVKHILFSRPNYTMSIGGTVYKTHEEVKAAFLSDKISETELKDQLIKEINDLLDPVRKHFAEDATAKELLAKITQWKKENLVAPSTLKRLQVSPPFGSELAVVFAPLPRETVRAEDVLSVLRRFRTAPAGAQKVLWLEDWTAMAQGCLGANKQYIKSFYEILLFGLKGLAPDVMKDVRVCWQGEMILSGPSEYWISVINAGRALNLNDVREALPPGESLEQACQVFSTLMHIGDLLSFTEAKKVTFYSDAVHVANTKAGIKLAEGYDVKGMEVVTESAATLRLMAPGEGAEADVNVALTDKEVEVNKKVKKSFCMPENVEFNPPIAWVGELLHFKKEFLITRKPDNGGDKTYTDIQELQKDFQSGALHPGDLKPAFGKALNALLEPLREGLKGKELTKAQKDLEAFTKAQSKKK